MDLYADPVMRRSLLSLIPVEERFTPLRARLVAAFLDGLATRSEVALYGCGTLARELAAAHGPSLERLSVFFLETRPDAAEFSGYPRRAAAAAVADPPEAVVLLSGSFEASMLQALAGLDPARIFTLAAVVETQAGEAEVRTVARVVEAEAEAVRAEAEPLFAGFERSICCVSSNFGIDTLERFRRMRELGWRVALFAPGTALPREARVLVDEGIADYVYPGSSPTGLWLLMSEVLRRTDTFRLVHAWIALGNHIFLEDWIEHGRARVVGTCDIYLPSYFEHQPSVDNLCRNIGVPFERLDRACRTIFGRAAGVLYKDSPAIFDDFRARYAMEPAPHLFYLPELVNRLTRRPVEKYSARNGEIHIVYGQSLHKDPLFSTMFDCGGIFREIEAVTAQKIHFTIFNSLDPDGRDYPEFLELDRENPYFHYRFRLPFPEYVREIRRHDFGWAGNDPAMADKLPTMFRRNMQLKILGYAQAGLPTLVAPQLEFCRELVEAEGIGMTIAREQWSGLRSLLGAYDMAGAGPQLEAFCDKLDIERHVPEMMAFFDRIVA